MQLRAAGPVPSRHEPVHFDTNSSCDFAPVPVGPVEGKDYDKEAASVVENGSEVPFELAEIFFKDLARTPGMRYGLKSRSGSEQNIDRG